jgi:hypothetical protein
MTAQNPNMALTITQRNADIRDDGSALIRVTLSGSFSTRDGKFVLLNNQPAQIVVPADEVELRDSGARSPFHGDPRQMAKQ